MTTPFYYSTTYVLDKRHFSETFEQSMPKTPDKSAYYKSIGLALLGFIIIYLTKAASYAGWFVIILAIVDACSVYFNKSWWLARQMISQAANTQLTLTIDEMSISSESHSVKSKILWMDVTHIVATDKGWLLHHSAGKTYLSSGCLSDQANAFVKAKASKT